MKSGPKHEAVPGCSLLQEINAAQFEAEVLHSLRPVLVAFWAPWSRPCQILNASLNEVARACAGVAKIVKVNADDNPDLSLWYDIESIPTVLCFVSGLLRGRIVGTASQAAILSKFESFLHQPSSPHPAP